MPTLPDPEHGKFATIGTGGDDFHVPARARYEALGCTPLPLPAYFKQL